MASWPSRYAAAACVYLTLLRFHVLSSTVTVYPRVTCAVGGPACARAAKPAAESSKAATVPAAASISASAAATTPVSTASVSAAAEAAAATSAAEAASPSPASSSVALPPPRSRDSAGECTDHVHPAA